MSESKHTPGPWEVQSYTNYKGWSVWANDRGCIAEGCIAERWYDADQQPDELKANARLIAAAPELLEACKVALVYPQVPVVEKALRAAIAKAERGEP